MRKLLVLDAAFSYEAIIERGLINSITCRNLEGYFSHVWSVHPFASLVTSTNWSSKYGVHVKYYINNSHTFIEGKVGRSIFLQNFPRINFILAQLNIIFVLIRLIRKEKISVIRVGDPLYLGIIGYILSKITGIPYLVRIGANYEKIRTTTGKVIMPGLFPNMKLERFVEKFILKHAQIIAGANNDNLSYAIQSGAQLNKCTLFRYGNLIDPMHFAEINDRKLNYEDFVKGDFIICISRLEKVKRVDDVIRVLWCVRNAGLDYKALIVGDGREFNNINDLVNKLGLVNQVIFCGNKNQQWLSATIPIAKVAVSPHTGRALTEVALGALPIAAYDIDWQAELIENGVTGELVTFGDWNALAKSVIKLLRNREYAVNLGKNARIKTLELMDPIRLNEHEKNIYKKILNI